ncbi:protein-tyrosine-phosphatase/DNA-binding transcriptional ArsR family regulator [Actinoplanes octamycinicus]|uniref:Protein-tyrosine-phosphatase/DNA-binding transcriptional ArsR family regulator n=1 Tax=Actinoplanes octamycinicus TaxID=135948 RepID=A0A7W7H2H8_9ACTN|nr:MarR family transcriptional regulator [Actinoplanes octamycinicus]MBB4742477.1 protein-tyrosine-phosphatase/DNA-binding transcriptional ArsR family regulator [Actinoplanes octamycinicus]GIE60815.1 ArsR family transcriptional regulator [Actinoplanes octamycinicus]
MSAPPAFLTAAGHPVRWRLLSELARTDLAVRELTALLGQPQNLISYHLGKLRRSELVTARRSSADGRDTYYSLDLTRCAALLTGAGAALHPALRLRPPTGTCPAGARVLFLCTGNSARSPMAEALLRARTAGRVEAHSAGSHPKPLHPHAVTVLARRGIDLAGARPRHLDEFAGQRFDHVVTLCDRVKEVCPEFPGHRRPTHWSLPEPADLATFDEVADRLDERIGHLSQLIGSVKEA